MLWWAARVGHEAAVRTLFEMRTAGNNSDHQTLELFFLWARDNGRGAIAGILLGKDAAIGKLRARYSNALQAAAAVGNKQVLKI